jgi:hypothetical protein
MNLMDKALNFPRISAHASRLWKLMQRIEHCRHRAEMAEHRARCGSETYRREMADVAKQWRDLAHQFELMDAASEQPVFRTRSMPDPLWGPSKPPRR